MSPSIMTLTFSFFFSHFAIASDVSVRSLRRVDRAFVFAPFSQFVWLKSFPLLVFLLTFLVFHLELNTVIHNTCMCYYDNTITQYMYLLL